MAETSAKNPGGRRIDRLMEELAQYLEARAAAAITHLGERVGEATKQLSDPNAPMSAALASLGKGGKALSEGKSPGGAAMSMGLSLLKDRAKGMFAGLAGKGPGRRGRGKSVVVIEDIDVGVPVREAYDQWTRFEEFGKFSKGVVGVERSDDTSSHWQVKVAKVNRSWKATVTEQIPDECIAWTSEGAKGTTKGVVTFHPLGEDLTKVLLVLEYFPQGPIEKTGNIWRAQGRRARLDLKLYRKFVTMRDEPAEGWRGEIRDGEVVRDHEEAVEEEERERRHRGEGDEDYEYDDRAHDDSGDEEDEEREDDEDPAKGHEEDEEPYEDEEPGDEDEEPYEEQHPRRRAASRR